MCVTLMKVREQGQFPNLRMKDGAVRELRSPEKVAMDFRKLDQELGISRKGR